MSQKTSELLAVETGSGLQLVADLAQKASAAEIVLIPTEGLGEGLPAQVPVLFDRANQRVISLKPSIEEQRQAPQRRAGTATVQTLESFILLVQRHRDEHSVVFGNTAWPNPALTAVIDYHQTDRAPRPGAHRIRYTFPLTEELKAWIGQNGKPMSQEAFAAFLEEHAAELAAPLDAEKADYERLFKEQFANPNELVELSRHLEVFVGAKAKQGVRLQTGERVVEFSEEHTNGRGEKVEIPGIFMISVPAFVDGEAVRMPVRLRYRIRDGEIAWFYQIYRWEFWLRDRVQNDLLKVEKALEIPTYEGAPEA